jgi:hypothetical protein
MWLLVSRPPPPDAPYWPGRRWFAALDAVGWPMAMGLAVAFAPMPAGLLVPMVIAVSALIALGRCRRALWVNHRYRFTTWRWGRVVALLLVVGSALKVASSF